MSHDWDHGFVSLLCHAALRQRHPLASRRPLARRYANALTPKGCAPDALSGSRACSRSTGSVPAVGGLQHHLRVGPAYPIAHAVSRSGDPVPQASCLTRSYTSRSIRACAQFLLFQGRRLRLSVLRIRACENLPTTFALPVRRGVTRERTCLLIYPDGTVEWLLGSRLRG